jgi:hypothetical protein
MKLTVVTLLASLAGMFLARAERRQGLAIPLLFEHSLTASSCPRKINTPLRQ